MSDIVREKMLEARDLIQAQRYSDARALLVTIHHPKADEWLRKLDDIESRERVAGTQMAQRQQMSAETVETRNPYAHQPIHDPIPDASVSSFDRDALLAQPEAKRTSLLNIIGALIGGLVGAAIGGAIWAAIAFFTDREVGYVALGVGFLAGLLAVVFSGGRRGIPIQIVAIVTALLGIVVGKYAAVYAIMIKIFNEEAGTDMTADILREFPPVSAEMVQTVIEIIGESVQPIDALFVVLAGFAAIRVAANTRKPRQPALKAA